VVWLFETDHVNHFPLGFLSVCDWNPAIPNLPNCFGRIPNGNTIYYEPTDTDAREVPTCTIYYQVIPTGTSLNASQVYKWNSCTQDPPVPLTENGIYSEFWRTSLSGDLAIYTTSRYLPAAQQALTFFPPPLDLAMSDASTGQNPIQLTCYNNPPFSDYSPQNGVVSVSDSSQSPDGAHIIVGINMTGPPRTLQLHKWDLAAGPVH
jgi:hypothetical protein